MVATRNHPKDFPPPPASLTGESSPTKRTTRSSTTAASASPTPTPTKSSSSTTSLSKATDPSGARAAGAWTHTPSNLTLIWLAISLPLVIWDTGYVLLRPWSMPGGFLHSPIWAPYELYGRVDYVYGWPAYESNDGWTASQGWVNLVETAAYLGYLYLVYAYGARESEVVGRGAPDAMRSVGGLRWLTESRTLEGRVAAIAVLVAYSTALVTFAKTVLYWLIEALSGFDSIGHNDWTSLIFLWIIPNGAWLVFPLYMLYVFGQEILEGLETAVIPAKKRD
ncbi:uncharacterized protein K489DRAFT_375751 [Dissoconium aciculare CBS 342.82]|uniref:Emopamil-binding protein n=1 Tax=Dissoconium aciculare CBS 342.82 TaxID=1314786 RepID=A0A6J3MI75_9PEZI|nr:uncharacterized protein K489DRAFT_375751 [Dissoconium aciculare CBS 342.82]KAF1827631.1 hypothetical protein K489DRAFT_375751 [Dissoconium aciculare CBS 342.82]